MNSLKWVTAGINVCVIILVLWKWELILDWAQVRDTANLPAVFLLVTLLAAIPGVPFGIVGGIMGAKYGIWLGSLLNLAASTAAAGIAYLVFRYLFRTWASALTTRSTALKRWNQAWEKHAFPFILIARMIPILPAFLINLNAGVMNLPFKPFLLATLLGKIPVMVVFAYIGNQMKNGVWTWMIVAAIYGVFLAVVYRFYKLYRKKSRA
ncbi:TVP38/TMEM64 family protein [Paenibacillus spongiae]|uniref:TVP38/TMEM64 family membrane protein n=1 Tax=Paenibacillus spongiae TaxID=2909671 RepID=A0ABY5SJC1_9BACL|nr:VTT domain-containing protein [Paenibacillus spongiae]UVI32770.1 VTT domain-containing protein [Paenibacillus spongiae]